MVKKILIVDDDPDFLFVLGRVLTRAGYEVVSADGGKEGLEKAAEENPDLVVLDIMMPDMNGWEVCRKIKRESPDLPVAMCSVLRYSDKSERSLNYAGADEHITKPIDFDNFLETVNTLM